MGTTGRVTGVPLAGVAASRPQEIAPRTFFVPAFGNVSLLETDEGLLMVDSGGRQEAQRVHSAARALTPAILHTVVFTHGHLDHTMGLGPWLDQASAQGAPRPRIVAHRNVARRFREYLRMPGLNEHINRIQFGFQAFEWPTEFVWPDTVYDESMCLSIGGERFELRHGRGETDDATWVWAAERKVLLTGDFWISCAPNCGNPQKVQRYAEDWVHAFEAMGALGAELLLPGHGPALEGADVIATCLGDAAAYLRSIIDQTLDALNAGLRHEEVVAAVRVSEDLASKPYLRAIYDRPEFIVRNLIRLHGGWWDGFAANLMPAAPEARAREIVELAGGVERVVARARRVAETDLALACHLAEWAALAEPADSDAQECVVELFTRRADQESSLMGRGIYSHAARGAQQAIEDPSA